jgi:hypothetical protein
MSSRVAASRIGWWCGLAGTVLVVAGFFAIDDDGTADADGPVAFLVHQAIHGHGRTIVGVAVGTLGALLLVGFGAELRSRLSANDDLLAHAGLAFATLAAAGGILHGSLRLAIASVRNPTALGEAMRTLTVLGEHSRDLLFWGVVGLVATVSLAALRSRLVPRPMAWVGLALVAGTLALAGTDHGGVAVAMFPWLAVICLQLLTRPELEA